MAKIAVYVEQGAKRTFASAAEWPGWARAGRTEEAALIALAGYAPRYAEVASRAGFALPTTFDLSVVEHLPGDATTDFGAPSTTADGERLRLTPAKATRQAALVNAAWAVLADVAAATPSALRKGPRGGGRDRDKMLDHVVGAEVSYARLIGLRFKQPAFDDAEAIAAIRAAITEVLGSSSDGAPLRERGWTSRYAARRIAWHVLDHAWEMQDRTES